MIDRKKILIALGEGALVGTIIGAAIGAMRVERTLEFAQGTPLLAAWTLLKPMAWGAACGTAFSISAAVVLGAMCRVGSVRMRLAAAAVMGVSAALWIWAVLAPLHEATVPFAHDERPKLVVAGTAFLALFGATLPGLRALDLRRASRGGGLRALSALLGGLAVATMGVGWVTLVGIESARAEGRPNVLILCLDTMRADALGVLGNHERTPLLDRLAEEGVLFEQATAPAPWTLPSHASLFTSRLPWDHGVRFSMNRVQPFRLTLAERFREFGYRTGGFTGDAYVDAHFGFDQGFDRYDDFHEEIESGPQPIASAALEWIRADRGRPFFAFVHTYEPHAPYAQPDFADPADRGGLPEVFLSEHVQRIQDGDLVLTESQRRWVRAMYAGDVHRADRVMGGLLETLRTEGVLDRTLLVVLSDHGEDLWDHDAARSPGHGHSLYQELLHVPLFIRAPGLAAQGVRIRTPVSLLDIAPTLLELCGLASDERIHGRSLANTIRTGHEPSVAPVWSESVEFGPDRFALREGRWKAIVTPRPDEAHSDYHPVVRTLEVFDLVDDPDETRDLSATPNDEVLRLVRVLTERAWDKLEAVAPDEIRAEPDDELMRTLKSLGYVR